MKTKEEILNELKKRGVTLKLEDYSCGCCGYSTLEIYIDNTLQYEGSADGPYGELNLCSIEGQNDSN